MNNSIGNFSSLPTELNINIFSNIPREVANVLPYVCKSFKTFSNRNDLWDRIAELSQTKKFKLDIPYNLNEAKFTYLMRCQEIKDMFINGSFFCWDTGESKINQYMPIDQTALEKLNHEINMGQEYISRFSASSISKNIEFMLDACQKPTVKGYLKTFIHDKEAICLIMNKCKACLESEYQTQKQFLEKIERSRQERGIAKPLTLNNIEQNAIDITTIYEQALAIYSKQ